MIDLALELTPIEHLLSVNIKGELEISSEARGYEIIRDLLARDKGSPGDADGRKKKQSIKELMFCWNVVSYRSPYVRAGFEGEELYEKSAISVGLNKNYQPDPLVKEIIKWWHELQDTPALKLLNEIRSTLNMSATTAKLLKSKINGKLVEAQDKIARGEAAGDDIAIILNDVQQLMQFTNIVVKNEDTVNSLAEKTKNELSKKKIAKGGKEIGNRADPR